MASLVKFRFARTSHELTNVRPFPVARKFRDGTPATGELGDAPDPVKLRPWGASEALRRVLAAADEFVSAGDRAVRDSRVLDEPPVLGAVAQARAEKRAFDARQLAAETMAEREGLGEPFLRQGP